MLYILNIPEYNKQQQPSLIPLSEIGYMDKIMP